MRQRAEAVANGLGWSIELTLGVRGRGGAPVRALVLALLACSVLQEEGVSRRVFAFGVGAPFNIGSWASGSAKLPRNKPFGRHVCRRPYICFARRDICCESEGLEAPR